MTPVAILAIIIALVQAASITLPVTQDFAVVNQDRISSVIARNDTITLFNNGLTSSISYFGVDTIPFIQEALITTNTPVASMIESATLIFKQFNILSEQTGRINIQISSLNPGQAWDENTVTQSTTPTIKGSLGTVDFSQAEPSVDVTTLFTEAVSGAYQGTMFGFQIGLPGGPVSVPSHRSAPGSIVVEVLYSPLVGPGGTAPPTTSTAAPSTTTTTRAPAPATTTTSAPLNCWTCGAGWVHWYEVAGAKPEGNDPCACVRVDTVTTITAAPTTTTSAPAPGSPSTSAAPATTTTAAPGAPSTAQPAPGSSTDAASTTSSAPNQPERNSGEKVVASALAIVATLALLL